MKNRLSLKLIVMPLILSFVLLPLLLFAFLKFVSTVSDKSYAEYRALTASLGLKKEEAKKDPYKISQKREKVQKDTVFFKKGEELAFKLLADSGELIFDHQGLKTEVKEDMENVTCYMQEELYYLLPDGREVDGLEDGTFVLKGQSEIVNPSGLKPVQIVRKLEALRGIYYYKPESFSGKNVKIERFLMEGHKLLEDTLPIKKLMGGIAETAEFNLQEKTLGFKADQLKAEFKDGAELLSAKATIDYAMLKGQFRGDVDHQYVIYKENFKRKSDKRFPLLVQGEKMEIELSKKSAAHQILKVTAKKNVTLNYNQDFIASGDFAEYQRLNDGESQKIPGHICLLPLAPKHICQVTNKNGDTIYALGIDLDTVKQKLQFKKPVGFLLLGLKDAIEKIYFESDFLHWDNKLNMLSFNGNVMIRQKAYGDLQATEEVKLYYLQEAGKKKIKEIETLGETVLAHTDAERKFLHTLTAYGRVLVDHIALKTTVESPLDSDGRVSEGRQIYFNDIFGEIYADRALLQYEEINGLIAIKKLLLEGNVRILNRSSVNPEESEAFLQYALADKAEFFPGSQELLLSAHTDQNKRVLFYDKVNALEVSAPGVKIKRDAKLKRESIQGIGDTRFSLDGHELEKLKAHFSLEPTKGTNTK